MKRLSYYPARAAVKITSIVLISQIMVEMGGPVSRKPEFWWVIYACAGAFVLSALYAIAVVVRNAWVEYCDAIKAVEGETK
jgi:hypothetical protein